MVTCYSEPRVPRPDRFSVDGRRRVCRPSWLGQPFSRTESSSGSYAALRLIKFGLSLGPVISAPSPSPSPPLQRLHPHLPASLALTVIPVPAPARPLAGAREPSSPSAAAPNSMDQAPPTDISGRRRRRPPRRAHRRHGYCTINVVKKTLPSSERPAPVLIGSHLGQDWPVLGLPFAVAGASGLPPLRLSLMGLWWRLGSGCEGARQESRRAAEQ